APGHFPGGTMPQPMWQRLKKLWPVAKVLMLLAILAGVGLVFARILQNPQLQENDPLHRPPLQILQDTLLHAQPAWLIGAAVLYLAGLGFSMYFWFRLLRALDQQPALPAMIRAYYIGHLGKYVPGKAWALLLRTTLAGGPGVRLSVAAMTAVYETLTTMAAGSLLA